MGTESESVSVAEGSTVDALVAQLREKSQWQAVASLPLSCAVNEVIVKGDHVLRDGDAEAAARSDAEIDELLANGRVWLAESDGQPVSMATIIGLAGGRAMIGGVWTPEGERNQGFARSVVAGALDALSKEGASRGVLFTGRANEAAQAAYKAIGFERIGRYGRAHF